ncbi:MAG: DUF1385 domain-containing protein [Dehalococcoidales bacterium]|nr:DUF1385 domain-containing protein [Dehalococcoidales bacterium]
MAEKIFHYGGQAVMEGVMIRGEKHMVTVVRRSNGETVVDKQPIPRFYAGWMRSVPLLRGIIVLIESLVFGFKTLMYSANVALEEEDEKVGGWLIWVTLALSLVFGVAIFFITPLFITRLFTIDSAILFNLVEGLIRLAIFLIYIRLITFMPDIKRVFAYHGAEHKAVNGFEAGASLEPEAVRKFSKAHIRCGGSFLFAVMVIAIIVFSLVGKQALWLMVLSRILLVPVIAALGYEFIHFGAKHSNNIIMKILLTPGLWLQSMTTREPDDEQLRIGIMALKTAIEADKEAAEPSIPNEQN